MAGDKVKILDSTTGLLDNISPTGVKYDIKTVDFNNALYRISAPHVLPASLSGYYTSAKQAQIALSGFLIKQWQKSDAIASESKSKRAV